MTPCDKPQVTYITPSYAEVRPFRKIIENNFANNVSKRPEIPEPEHFGGFITFGTSANFSSTASGIAYQVNFTPAEGPIPAAEMEIQYKAQQMENKPFIIRGLTKSLV